MHGKNGLDLTCRHMPHPPRSAYHDAYVKWRQRQQEEGDGVAAEDDDEDAGELKLWSCPVRRQMVRSRAEPPSFLSIKLTTTI